jgi:hypothetical protein
MSLRNGDGVSLDAVTKTITKQIESTVHGKADSVDCELLADIRALRSVAVRVLVACERMQDELDGPGRAAA